MTTALKTSALVFVIAAICTIAACGGGDAAMSLTGPSRVGSSTATSGATITGRVNAGSALAQTTTIAPASMPNLTVSIAGTGISAQVDNRGGFTLTSVPSGPVRLQFRGPGVDASLTITVDGIEQIQIAVTVNGGSARIESERHSGSNNRGELVGRITEIDAAARTLRVSGTLVAVPATATIRHGSRVLQFADLMVGDHVEVHGTMEGTTLNASEIKVEGDNRGGLMERRGAVSALSGTCPALTFTIGTTRVVTDGSTFFKEGACADVVNGALVEVKGRPQADGSLVAVKVELDEEDDRDDDDEAEVKGSVSGLTGTCPALSFLVGTTRVTTTMTTRFDGGCSAIQNGRRVEITGTRQANGSIVAARVEMDD